MSHRSVHRGVLEYVFEHWTISRRFFAVTFSSAHFFKTDETAVAQEVALCLEALGINDSRGDLDCSNFSNSRNCHEMVKDFMLFAKPLNLCFITLFLGFKS